MVFLYMFFVFPCFLSLHMSSGPPADHLLLGAPDWLSVPAPPPTPSSVCVPLPSDVPELSQKKPRVVSDGLVPYGGDSSDEEEERSRSSKTGTSS